MTHPDQKKHLIYFNSRDRLVRINLQDTVYFESQGNYSYVFTTDKQKAYLNINLTQVETVLRKQFCKSAKAFLRVGKRFIINCDYIYQIDTTKQHLILSFNNNCIGLPVSKEALRQIKKYVIETKI